MKTFRTLATLFLAAAIALVGSVVSASSAGANTVSGTVTSGGMVVDGAFVTLNFTGQPSQTVQADGSGDFSFVNIPDGTVFLSANDPLNRYRGYWGYADEFTLDSTNTSPVVNIELPAWSTGNSSLSGVVRDAATNALITDAQVWINGSDAKPVDVNVDPVTGAYSFSDLPAGAYMLGVSAPGYVTKTLNPALDADDAVTLDIQLLAANSTIYGTVSIGGAPVQYTSVSYQQAGVPGGMSVQTNEFGVYEIPQIGAGEYTVTVGGGGIYRSQSKAATAVGNTITTVDFAMELRLHGTISGTVYDKLGAPLEGICITLWVSPTDAVNGLGMGVGTGADGTYTLTDVDAGTYRISFDDNCPALPGLHNAEYALSYYGGTNGAASYSEGTPIVTNGGDPTGFDIRMLDGGGLGGKVSLQTSSGITDLPSSRGMAGTVYQQVGSDWVEVPTMTPFVGGPGVGDYQTYGLYPGLYRVCFEDSITGTRAFAYECWKDSATLENATDIVVTAGNFTGNINAAVGIPRPGFDPVAVPTDQLDAGLQGAITSDSAADQGQSIDINVGADLAGEWINVWGHSTPTLMGSWVQVSSTGSVNVTVPRSLPAGAHTLVAQNSNGGVVGWNTLKVRGVGGLASTGIEATPALLGGGLGILLGGMLIIFVIRRRRSQV